MGRQSLSKILNGAVGRNDMNKHIFILLWCVLFIAGGCSRIHYNVVTKQEELVLIGDERELKIGRSVARKVENQFKLTSDNLLREKVKKIGAEIVLVCDRTQIPYHFEVLEEEKPNAFAVPGGFIYVHTSLIDMLENNDDELACILAHEVAHIVARHSMKRLQSLYGYNLLRIFSATAASQAGWDARIDRAIAELFLSYSREDETLADKLAVRYAAAAGYDPEAMITFLEKLQKYHFNEPIKKMSYAKTHPYLTERIRVVKEEVLGQIDFKDVMNTSR